MSQNHRTTAAKVTAELNIHLGEPLSIKTVRQELHISNNHGTAVIAEPLITENNIKMRKRWCNDDETWMSDDCKYVIWPDESSFTLFPASGRIYVWRTPKKTYNPECLVQTVKHGGGSVIIWAAISWYSAGPVTTLNGRITASENVAILDNQVRPVVQILFPNNDAIFQDANPPIHTTRSVQSWFEGHEDALQHVPWPAQSPDLNIIETIGRFWRTE